MRRLALFALLTTLGGCAEDLGHQMALCSRDTVCSANPRPTGQNGVNWQPVGRNTPWSPGGTP